MTQTASHTRLEQICEMERIAADRDQSAAVRKVAESELEQIREGGAVDPSYQRVKAALWVAATSTPDDVTDDLEALTEAALARAKEDRAQRIRENRLKRASAAEHARRSLRSFALMWTDLQDWSTHYDAAEVGQELNDTDWAMFERVVKETDVFADSARSKRRSKSA